MLIHLRDLQQTPSTFTGTISMELASKLIEFLIGPVVRPKPARTPVIITTNDAIEEQIFDRIHPRHYYPMRLGCCLNDRYQVIAKLGFGSTSTSWLARDTQRYVCANLNPMCPFNQLFWPDGDGNRTAL